MSNYELNCAMRVDRPLAEVFSVFEDPRNLKRITPPWLGLTILDEAKVAMRLDAEIRYRLGWMGLPLRWKTRITAYDPPLCFVDEQEQGPYRFWRHRHTFEAVEGGTLVRDHVEYALPLGWLGRLAHRLVVRRQVEEIFRYRQHALAALFAGTTAP